MSALINGDVVQFAHEAAAEGIGWVHDAMLSLHGHFTLLTPVSVGRAFSGKTITGGHYTLADACIYGFEVKDCDGITLDNMIIARATRVRRGAGFCFS